MYVCVRLDVQLATVHGRIIGPFLDQMQSREDCLLLIQHGIGVTLRSLCREGLGWRAERIRLDVAPRHDYVRRR